MEDVAFLRGSKFGLRHEWDIVREGKNSFLSPHIESRPLIEFKFTLWPKLGIRHVRRTAAVSAPFAIGNPQNGHYELSHLIVTECHPEESEPGPRIRES